MLCDNYWPSKKYFSFNRFLQNWTESENSSPLQEAMTHGSIA